MADQYELTLQDYVYDLMRLSNNCFSQGMLSIFYRFQQLKPTQVIVATLMLYDFIDHIPQQVGLSICRESFHIFLLS